MAKPFSFLVVPVGHFSAQRLLLDWWTADVEQEHGTRVAAGSLAAVWG